jgi:PhoH-like ATPase
LYQQERAFVAITYILDTSVLLASPKSILSFHEHEVVLPLIVIKELENKRNDAEIGYLARQALRSLEELRTTKGDLKSGVVVNVEGGTLRIEVSHGDRSLLPEGLRDSYSNDTSILAVAATLSSQGKKVVLVSKDLPMRLLASTAADIIAEDYKRDTLPDSGYTGVVQVQVERETLDSLYENKTLRATSVSEELKDIPANTGVIVKSGRSSAMARISAQGALELIPQDLEAFGVKGRSAEQRIALAHLLDDSIGIVSMSGSGGTGKSMLALAAGLEAVLERRTKKKIVVFRPLLAVGGQELGFLPGTEAEKMNPWAAAVFDALSAFASKNVIEDVIDRGIIEVLPLTHIRGRTFTDTIIIVDEAQNLERNVLLTALSRTGDNSRVFISSDVAQRDNLRVGRHDGIASVVEKLKGEELFAHVKLVRSERSQVAEMVTRLLDE